MKQLTFCSIIVLFPTVYSLSTQSAFADCDNNNQHLLYHQHVTLHAQTTKTKKIQQQFKMQAHSRKIKQTFDGELQELVYFECRIVKVRSSKPKTLL